MDYLSRNHFNKILKAAQEMHVAAEQGNLKELWSLAYKHSTKKNSKPKTKLPETLSTFFEAHFNQEIIPEKPPEIDNPPADFYPDLSRIKIDQNLPTKQELVKAVNSCKYNKSALDFPAEVIRAAIKNDFFLDQFLIYYQDIWRNQTVPKEWGESVICPIWKRKGKMSDPTKYRGISLTSTLAKVGCIIVLNRIREFYNASILSTQYGFRSGKGCDDALFHFSNLQTIAKTTNTQIYHVAIDYSQAFDLLVREWAFDSIESRIGRNDVNIGILRDLYSKTSACVTNKPDYVFSTSRGVRQGGNESPIVYGFYNDTILRLFKSKCKEAGIPEISIKFQIPSTASKSRGGLTGIMNLSEQGYADDTLISFQNPEHANQAIPILFEICGRFGLKVNMAKTETLISNKNDPEPFLKLIENEKEILIPAAKSIKVLGSYRMGETSQCSTIGSTEVGYRIATALNSLKNNEELLRNQNLDLNFRRTFLTATVRSRLCYACKSWRLNKQELSRLESAWNRSLRLLVKNGEARKPKSWAYVYTTKEIYKLTGLGSLEDFIMNQQVNYCAHLIRSDDTTINKQLLFHNEKKRLRGRFSSQFSQVCDYAGVDESQFHRMSLSREIGRSTKSQKCSVHL